MHRTDIHTLARLPLLRGSNRRQLMLVDRLTTALEVPPERTLCHQGAPGHHFYVILTGRAAGVRHGRIVALLVFGRVGYRTLLEAIPQAAARIAERAQTRSGLSLATEEDVASLAG